MVRMLLVLKNSDVGVYLAAASEFLKDNSLKQAVYPISNQPAACTVYLVTDWVLEELSCRKCGFGSGANMMMVTLVIVVVMVMIMAMVMVNMVTKQNLAPSPAHQPCSSRPH